MIHNFKNRIPVVCKKRKGNVTYTYLEINIGNKKYRYARLLMENYLNRKLKSNEVVHHKNKNTLDNRINNLQVMLNKNHNSLHSLGKNNAMYGKCKEKHPNWRSVKIICPVCKKKVYKQLYSIKTYKKHFCSRDCLKEYRKIHIQRIAIACPLCKKITLKFPSEIKRNRKFCSLKCVYNYKKLNSHFYYTDISNRPRDKFGRLIKYVI